LTTIEDNFPTYVCASGLHAQVGGTMYLATFYVIFFQMEMDLLGRKQNLFQMDVEKLQP
jgi:hypothetical protein